MSTTPQNELLSAARRLLTERVPEAVRLQELYVTVEQNVLLTDDDSIPPTLRGRPTAEPGWQRNLRNALQQEKRSGRLANVREGLWSLPTSNPELRLDPETSWDLFVQAARVSDNAVFSSPTQGRRYRVLEADRTAVTIERVDGSEPARITPGELVQAAIYVNAGGGRTGLRTVNYTVAKETAIVHLHPFLAWDETGGWVIAVRAERPTEPTHGFPLRAEDPTRVDAARPHAVYRARGGPSLGYREQRGKVQRPPRSRPFGPEPSGRTSTSTDRLYGSM
jgi:hypothetical protein